MRSHRITFSGALLQRGFWIYVWRVEQGSRKVFYVGRTGDSSSAFAASPFLRLGQHLDHRPKASANMLLRNLGRHGFDPLRCKYSLVAVGPLFPEQPTLPSHRRIRDRVAPIEAALAKQLEFEGHAVIGTHPKSGVVNSGMYRRVLQRVRSALKLGAR